ncbi:ATP-binding protein [Salmonella enterica]|nr:ATP-binding protein [Salmonella enterica]MCT6978562.1 ATP-binding protein [Salmonella enterica subsp. enterica serovar Oranienburg]MCT7058825.1 ATP-binding protein [Salmonella enterica subsp. enterica serovar Oranienburg]MCT7080907.1 ATP-binding protein [Salmonella enterica subsp. enterica serovar Oranienburg]MCT7147479.1 ATP-binding protein [Salmonella enterica subsp. enterica serovar Oranienburg]MCX0012827.1 ATP-binding protein [Salmonella enterica subsp. enterica serovar Oranienburg]
MMQKQRVSQVFVPGGMPKLTYVERTQGEIREKLESAKDNLCKLVTLTGQTKSGKTVLTQMIFPFTDPNVIWVDGGSITAENDIWEQVLDRLDVYPNEEVNTSDTASTVVSGKANVSASILIAKGGGELGVSQNDGSTKGKKSARNITSKNAAIKALAESQASLIIDDFHYLDRDMQGSFVRAVKPLVFHGVPVVLIAIPHRRYDAIKVEREITGRLENIMMPYWSIDELKQIATIGFPLLNVNVSSAVVDILASEALGSPHLMQEFCKSLCADYSIKETSEKEIKISKVDDSLFKNVAESTGKVVFDKLATGPRQRSDRLMRLLKSGERVDIYKVVLYALSKMKPGMQTIQYEELRSAIRDIVAETPPQAHEVTRVLEKMSEIASNEEASTPVIDWEREEQKLHITDPFFAFYLKWRAH